MRPCPARSTTAVSAAPPAYSDKHDVLEPEARSPAGAP